MRHGEQLAPALIVHLHDLRTLQHFYEVTHGAQWSDNRGWKVYGPAGDPCSSLPSHGWPTEWPETSKHFFGAGCRDPCDPGIEGENCQLGRISRIELRTNSLSGTLPPALATLKLLSIFDLGDNNISGTIPTQLGLLEHAHTFNLNNNRISGTIPTQLGSLGNRSLLTSPFDIATGARSSLYRPNPLATRLHQLNLNNNRLSGAIPTELGRHTWLEDLKLNGNPLLGVPLPRWNRTIERFNYTVDTVTGQVVSPEGEDGASNSTEVRALEVPVFRRVPGFSGLTGLPTELGRLTRLRVLQVTDTNLQAALPSELGQLSNLIFLHVTASHTTGFLPTELGSLPRLQYLRLAQNQISGTIPIQLGNATNLGRVDFESNRLSGSLPDFFDQFRHLEYWSTFDCRLPTNHVPPSVTFLAQRLMHFEFYVQDEQLGYLADFRCGRDRFTWQTAEYGGVGRKINYVPRLAQHYMYYRQGFCEERNQPGGLAAQFIRNFGAGERYPNGILKPGQRIYHGFDSDVFIRSKPISGFRFRREDAEMLSGDPGSFNWEPDENGDDSPPASVGIPIPMPPPGTRRRWNADPQWPSRNITARNATARNSSATSTTATNNAIVNG